MIIRGQSERPYPEFCGVGGTQPTAGSSSYNALQATLNRRFSHGLTGGAQYVWGHSIGNTDGSKDARSSSNNYSFATEHGDNISDVRQSFNLS